MIEEGQVVSFQYEDESQRRIGKILKIEMRQSYFTVYSIMDRAGRMFTIHEGRDVPEQNRTVRHIPNSVHFIMWD